MQTVGTFDNPGEPVESARMDIQGADAEFAYVAGEPIYRDPQMGMLLRFYHAECHFAGDGSIFHAAIGLAASNAGGQPFQNLGIILETNPPPVVGALAAPI